MILLISAELFMYFKLHTGRGVLRTQAEFTSPYAELETCAASYSIFLSCLKTTL